MPKVPYPYEVNGNLVTGNGSLIPIRSLSNRSLLPSLTVQCLFFRLVRTFVHEHCVKQKKYAELQRCKMKRDNPSELNFLHIFMTFIS